MFCGQCGKNLPDDVRFCQSCGRPTAPAPIVTSFTNAAAAVRHQHCHLLQNQEPRAVRNWSNITEETRRRTGRNHEYIVGKEITQNDMAKSWADSLAHIVVRLQSATFHPGRCTCRDHYSRDPGCVLVSISVESSLAESTTAADTARYSDRNCGLDVCHSPHLFQDCRKVDVEAENRSSCIADPS